jgi:hypothetical protein
MTYISPDIKEEEKLNDDELPKFSFEKSEISNNLFPMGYPNARNLKIFRIEKHL